MKKILLFALVIIGLIWELVHGIWEYDPTRIWGVISWVAFFAYMILLLKMLHKKSSSEDNEKPDSNAGDFHIEWKSFLPTYAILLLNILIINDVNLHEIWLLSNINVAYIFYKVYKFAKNICE